MVFIEYASLLFTVPFFSMQKVDTEVRIIDETLPFEWQKNKSLALNASRLVTMIRNRICHRPTLGFKFLVKLICMISEFPFSLGLHTIYLWDVLYLLRWVNIDKSLTILMGRPNVL